MEEYSRQTEEDEERERRRKQRERSTPNERVDRQWRESAPQTVEQAKSRQKPGLKPEPETRTKGRAGETDLGIEWVDQRVGNSRSCYFNISTVAHNEIRATIKQRSYKRDYAATGSLKTQVTPVAPIGTKGLLVVTDVTTGEQLERPWTWVQIGWGGLGWLSRLWHGVKGLFTNEE